MVRGCQKKIIYLKNPNSEVFEEAYFVVKDTQLCDKTDECDMVEEANRILDESISYKIKNSRINSIKKFFIEKITSFVIGIATGVIVALLIK